MKSMSDILKNLTMLGQLGLSFLTPILLCLLVCLFLQNHFQAPLWIYIPGFILGIGGSLMTVWKFGKAVMQDQKKQDRDRGLSRDAADRRRDQAGGMSNKHF